MKEIKSFLTESNSNSKPTVLNEDLWDAIERDNYKVYDAFVDFIKDYYAPNDNKKAYEIEDVVNNLMGNMFAELDSKYGKNITESRTEYFGTHKVFKEIRDFIHTLDIDALVTIEGCEEDEVAIYVHDKDWSNETARTITEFMEETYGAGLVQGSPAGGYKYMKFRRNTKTDDYFNERILKRK